MGFPADVRTRVLIRCARICCLCFKQCGTRMEVHHIVQEADGGPNTEANALPVCFDCHAEVGSYNPRHPKGTKYRDDELKFRRDAIFKLVESGTLIAQILIKQLPSNVAERSSESFKIAIDSLPAPAEPSAESHEFLKRVLEPNAPLAALAPKLKMLGADDGAWILDSLVSLSQKSARAIEALALLAAQLPSDQKLVAVEQSMRKVTLFGETEQKAAMLSQFDAELLRLPDDVVRNAFFADVLEVIRNNQFGEVNELMPALVGAHAGLPSSLWSDYVMVLIDQSDSMAFKGAPAAKRALANLPTEIAEAGLLDLTPAVVNRLGHSRYEATQRLAKQHASPLRGRKGDVAKDVATLSWRDFSAKHKLD